MANNSTDINKIMYHLEKAADQNLKEAQFLLGFLYFNHKKNQLCIKKGMYYLNMASNNFINEAHYLLGFLYHKGKYVDQDINKAIHFYKEGSSFNNEYSKNNLGIIFKNGFGDKIEQNIGYAIQYFEEAIRQKKSFVSMYNLAHIYIYNEYQFNLDKSIELLITPASKGINPPIILLCIEVIKKVGVLPENIIEELNKHKDITDDLKIKVINKILDNRFNLPNIFVHLYNNYRYIDFLYSFNLKVIISKSIKIGCKKDPRYQVNIPPSITSDFYEGFGI